MKAIIYSENVFGKTNGNVANGLVHHSEEHEIIGVIDSTQAGLDAGFVLDQMDNEIPIFKDIDDALNSLADHPEYFIYGITPGRSTLSKPERKIFFEAMENGMNILNGLPEFLSEDPEFLDWAAEYGVTITDVQKPLSPKHLHHFTGQIHFVHTPIIAVMGTDSAIGKRTTAQKLVATLRSEGLKVAFIATGHTGLLQGAPYGAVIDLLSAEYATGEVENAILEAVRNELPDIIIVEGQGALSHPSNTSSAAILKGSLPDAIILQHAPKRINYCTYPDIPIPTLQSEINLIEEFVGASVIAITLNHENMTDMELNTTIMEYEDIYQIPVTDVSEYGCNKLRNKLFSLFSELSSTIT